MNDLLAMPAPRDLRPHQIRAIEMLRKSLAKGNKHVVMQAPTGFGKTITASKVIQSARDRGHKVLFTVPRLSLVDQAVAEFEREGLTDIGVIQAQHPRTNPLASVQVASVQTLARRKPACDFGLVIVDECHERSDYIFAVMDDWPCHFVGLSATPWTKGLGLHWDDLVVAATVGDLIDAGMLSRFTVYAPDDPDLSGVKTKMGDYEEKGLVDVMAKATIVGNVVTTWLEKGEDRPTLVFGVNRAHAAQLQARFDAAGICAGYCDAYTDKVARNLLERDFRSGAMKVVCSVRTLTTGIDWPVGCIVDAAPTKSEMLHVQKIGRGLRVNPGTEDCIILDHAGNSLRLGLVTDIYHDQLDSGDGPKKAEEREKKTPLPKPCSECGALFTGAVCPACGAVRKPASGVREGYGELVEISTERDRRKKGFDPQAFWSMALWLDDEREKEGRMAKAMFKSYFGEWPPGWLDDERERPNRAFWNWRKAQARMWLEEQRRAAG